MEPDIRHTYITFNEGAAREFSAVFNEFTNAVEMLERDGDENVFQLLRGKYHSLLKQKLDRLAASFINKCEKAETMGRLRINFSERITFLLREFTRKSGSL